MAGEKGSQTRPWGLGSPLPSSFPSRTSFSSPAATEPGFWLCGLFSTPGAWVARGKAGKLVAHLVFCLSLTASSRGAPGTLTAETNTETRPSLNRKGSDAGARIKSGLLDIHQVEAVNSPARAAQSGALGGQVVQGHQGFFRHREGRGFFSSGQQIGGRGEDPSQTLSQLGKVLGSCRVSLSEPGCWKKTSVPGLAAQSLEVNKQNVVG